jgi:hypothetical protein
MYSNWTRLQASDGHNILSEVLVIYDGLSINGHLSVLFLASLCSSSPRGR